MILLENIPYNKYCQCVYMYQYSSLSVKLVILRLLQRIRQICLHPAVPAFALSHRQSMSIMINDWLPSAHGKVALTYFIMRILPYADENACAFSPETSPFYMLVIKSCFRLRHPASSRNHG